MSTHLVAEFLYVGLCQLFALAELLNPAVDFVFHCRSSFELKLLVVSQ